MWEVSLHVRADVNLVMFLMFMLNENTLMQRAAACSFHNVITITLSVRYLC